MIVKSEIKTMLGDAKESISVVDQTNANPKLPGRRLSFEEASDAVFAQYDETFRRLADPTYVPPPPEAPDDKLGPNT